jgi:PPOX class probable F420-dependent enzyme
MGAELERLAKERTVVVTTFRKSGDPVPTPVWVASLDGELVLWSERKAGKIKRIRNNGKVEVQASDFRGQNFHGAKLTGTARILDDAGSEAVRSAIARSYGILGQVTMFFSRLRGRDRTIGIAITLDE